MNSRIKDILTNLFNENYKPIEKSNLKDLVNDLITNCPMALNLDTGKEESLYSKQDIKRLNKLVQNEPLNKLYARMIKQVNLANEYLADIKQELIESLKVADAQIQSKSELFQYQIIFVEHNLEGVARLFAYGNGEYPILERPAYININHQEQIYSGIGKIDYSKFWSAKIEFESEIENTGLADMILYSGYYGQVEDAYWYRTCLILFESFNTIDIQQIQSPPANLPLFIYANAHDTESINIYHFD